MLISILLLNLATVITLTLESTIRFILVLASSTRFGFVLNSPTLLDSGSY